MRIALDVSTFFYGLTNGTPIYLYRLARALTEVDPDVELVLLYHHRRKPVADRILSELVGPRVRLVRMGFFPHGVPPGGWWYPRRPRIDRVLKDVDVFHAGDCVWPLRSAVPVVVSVLDLTTRLFPQYHRWANRWHDRKKLRWAAEVADRFIAISEATKRDLVSALGVDAARIDVVPLARGIVDVAPTAERVREVRRGYRLADDPYVLSVGTLEPRKNHGRLIRAFASLPEDLRHVRLVLAGGRGWKTGELDQLLAESPARDRIRMLGFVPASHLQALYAGAAVFAYPSLYEGFGLPVLEAMAAGAPVLASDVSSLPEVADAAALLVDPGSVDAIRDGLVRLLRDAGLRGRLIERGRAQEAQFTWQRTAELTLQSYRAARARRAAKGQDAR